MLFFTLKGRSAPFWFFVLIFNISIFYAGASNGQTTFNRIETPSAGLKSIPQNPLIPATPPANLRAVLIG